MGSREETLIVCPEELRRYYHVRIQRNIASAYEIAADKEIERLREALGLLRSDLSANVDEIDAALKENGDG